MRLSIIIPVLNEAGEIKSFLEPLQSLRKGGHELLLVDGGSRDATVEIARTMVDKLVASPAGRAMQMNAGAKAATGEVLLFLHADTTLPAQAISLIERALQGGRQWGRFDVRLSGRHLMLRFVERMMNWRSCLTGIATGDQAIFVKRDIFQQVGAFPEIVLMEDIEMSKQLKRIGKPACIETPVITSSRRWEQGGIFKTILLMWYMRFAYFLGLSPERLAKLYRQAR